MKTLTITAVLAALALGSFAEVKLIPAPPDHNKNIPPEKLAEIRAMKRARREKRTGGDLIQRERNARPFVFVNAQKRVAPAAFDQVLADMQRFFSIDFVVREGTFTGGGEKGFVYIIDDAQKPSLVIVPEEGWATVNVAKLGNENLESRTCKELWRAFAFVGGAADCEMPHSVMCPIYRPEDLDHTDGWTISPEPVQKMIKHLRTMGVKQYRRVTYEKACQEGWAPAPTNDNQKAIWDKVHAMPDKPIQIKYDPKRDK